MKQFSVCMCELSGGHSKICSFSTVRRATEEARELQRILSEDKKDEGFYYAVYDNQEAKVVYKAFGY